MNKVGNLLKEKRESLGLTIEDVVNETKIQKIYLDAIEKGDFSFFKNQEFYQQVFVGSYADYLGFDKGEVLKVLQDDSLNQVETNVKTEKVTPTEPIIENSNDNNVIEDNKNEINQLIEQINQNIDVSVSDYFEEETNDVLNSNEKIEEKPVDEIVSTKTSLNSSLLDEIEKINQGVLEKKELEDKLEVATPVITKDASYDLDLDSTAVIDLTSGIEIETVAKEQPKPLFEVIEEVSVPEKEEVDVQDIAIEQNNQQLENPFFANLEKANNQKPEFEIKDATTAENLNVLEELERNIHSAKDMQLINEDPEKTSMDLKIAKALGDSKAVLDDETSKKIKKDKIINLVLILLIILLLAVILYFVLQ